MTSTLGAPRWSIARTPRGAHRSTRGWIEYVRVVIERVEGFRAQNCTKFKLIGRLRPIGRKGQNNIRPTR
jgi:hypothetical protein